MVSLPSERSTRFGNPAWPGGRTANFAAFGSWPGVRQKDAERLRDSDALMRVAVPRRRGPAGLRDLFSFLLKLRLVRPVPDTSFGSPDAPACAVPVQALSRLALFQLGVVQGFSLFPFCLTSFLKVGIKKDRQLFAHCDQSTVSFSVFSFSNLLAANGLSKPFADGKSTGDSRFSGARGCSHLDGTK